MFNFPKAFARSCVAVVVLAMHARRYVCECWQQHRKLLGIRIFQKRI